MYCNKNFATLAGLGTRKGLLLGQHGRGRVGFFVPVTAKLEEGLTCGNHREFTVGFTRNGLPSIIDSRTDEAGQYLLLSSKCGYEKMGSGRIFTLASHHPRVIARGLGASGTAGRVGNWPEYLIQATAGDCFIVRWSGYRYGLPSTFYLVDHSGVRSCPLPEVAAFYDDLGMQPEFSIVNREGLIDVDPRQWRTL